MAVKRLVAGVLLILLAGVCQPSSPSGPPETSTETARPTPSAPASPANPYKQFEHKVVRIDRKMSPKETGGFGGGIETCLGCVIATSAEGVTMLKLSSDLQGLLEKRLTKVFIPARDIATIADVESMFEAWSEAERPNWPCQLKRL